MGTAKEPFWNPFFWVYRNTQHLILWCTGIFMTSRFNITIYTESCPVDARVHLTLLKYRYCILLYSILLWFKTDVISGKSSSLFLLTSIPLSFHLHSSLLSVLTASVICHQKWLGWYYRVSLWMQFKTLCLVSSSVLLACVSFTK